MQGSTGAVELAEMESDVDEGGCVVGGWPVGG